MALRPVAAWIAAALIAPAAHAEPLLTRNQSALVAVYGLPSPLPARLPPAGNGRIAGVVNWSNTEKDETAGDAQYDALAGRIEREVNSIVANCKLPPAADANLHYVIADLMQGVSLMRGGDPQRTRHDGAALVHGALKAYGKYFDDPEFRS